ncbi:MAG: hypothetical protein RR840_01430 [Clostridium sp.]
MYIKNISQILNLKGENRVNITKDSFISGKILSLTDGKGVVQLSNGAMIPSVFIMDNNLLENKNYRFQVKEYSDEKIVLKVANPDVKEESKTSDVNKILEKLNIPRETGQDIISKLIKFSIPARDENILNVFNNYNFIKEIRNLNPNELLNLLNNLTSSNFTEDSNEFIQFKNILQVLDNIDLDFLSLLEQNKIPATIDNISKMKSFIDKPFMLNDFLSSVKSSEFITSFSNTLDKNGLELLSQKLNIGPDNLKNILNYLEENNVDLYNMTSKDTATINTLISQGDNNNKIYNDLLSSLKNINLLNNLNKSDESTLNSIINSLSKSMNLNVDKSTLSNICIALKDNPALTNTLIGSELNSKDLLNLCQKILKNPLLTESSQEFLILKEVNKGAFQDLLSVKYTRADRFESLIVKSLSEFLGSKEAVKGNLQTLNQAGVILKDNPDIFSKLGFLPNHQLGDSFDINKLLSLNYTMLNFNFLDKQNLFKNNIIIKNKHSSKYIDINDVKLYVSVESNSFGLIEGYVSKKFNDISINLKANDNAIKPFKDKVYLLKNKLQDMGYNLINVSIDSFNEPSDILSLSDFFSNGTYVDLDVKV